MAMLIFRELLSNAQPTALNAPTLLITVLCVLEFLVYLLMSIILTLDIAMKIAHQPIQALIISAKNVCLHAKSALGQSIPVSHA